MKLVPTGVAARELGISSRTLQSWTAQGIVTPTSVTAGGHARWSLADLNKQVAAYRESSHDSKEGEV